MKFMKGWGCYELQYKALDELCSCSEEIWCTSLG